MKQISYFPVFFLVFLSMVRRLDFASNRRHPVLTLLQNRRAVRIVNEFAEVVRSIPDYELRAEMFKYNKSQPLFNVEFVVHSTRVMGYKLWIDGYEKYGMEHIYSRSALALHSSLCDAVAGSFFFTSQRKSFPNNLPAKCPFKLGKLYYIRNCYFDEKSTPPTFPGYKWRFDVQIGPEGKKDTNGTALLQYYFRIEWYDRQNATHSKSPNPKNNTSVSSNL